MKNRPSRHHYLLLLVIGLLQFSPQSVSGQKKMDLSLPTFEARPMVWLDDWKPADQKVSEQRKEAKAQVRTADILKSGQQYGKAEKAYLQAMETDSSWAYPPYQLACNYELSGQHDKAVSVFKKAVELGFADFPTALADDELGELRNGVGFNKTLAKMRELYIVDGKKKVGTPIAVRPKGDPPKDGWPLIMLLHGYGDTNLNYISFAKAWAELGFVAVAVPGSVPADDGRFMWTLNSTDPTLKELRSIVKSDLLSDVVNAESVFLLGFSQGALHSLLLTAEHRDEFAGVVALSPGGSMSEKMMVPEIAKGRKGRLVFIHGSEEPHAPIASRWKLACSKSGWEFMSDVHQGGHHFPRGWEEQREKVAEFLLK